MAIRPVNNTVLVQIEKRVEKQTTSGIYLNPVNKKDDEPDIGTVIAVAQDVNFVVEGEQICFKKFSGDVVGDNLVIIPADDILYVNDNDVEYEEVES